MTFIELNNVSKTFTGKNGTVQAVRDVQLAVDKGDIYGIIGYSGAGKSTLVRLFNGLEKPTTGEVLVDGQEISQFKQKELRTYRKKVGMIFQHFNLLWSRTVRENIEFPLELTGLSKTERRAKAEELLTLVGLSGRGDAYPSQLSGGQKQRVGIARALANDPEILLCDEATSALDPQTTEEVLKLLLEINQQLHLTIVLITHEMNVIRRICNKVAVMENGQVAEEGTVAKVFNQPEKEVTKRFVEQDLEPREDQSLLQAFIAENPGARLATLTFTKGNANEPVISQAIRQFDVDINVVNGNLRQTKEGSMGSLTVLINGETTAIDQTLAFFKEAQVGVEVLTYE